MREQVEQCLNEAGPIALKMLNGEADITIRELNIALTGASLCTNKGKKFKELSKKLIKAFAESGELQRVLVGSIDLKQDKDETQQMYMMRCISAAAILHIAPDIVERELLQQSLDNAVKNLVGLNPEPYILGLGLPKSHAVSKMLNGLPPAEA